MKKSVDTVLQALAKQVEGQQINSSSPVCYEPLLARDVVSCGNSIAMESEYSYSQAEIETIQQPAPLPKSSLAFLFQDKNSREISIKA